MNSPLLNEDGNNNESISTSLTSSSSTSSSLQLPSKPKKPSKYSQADKRMFKLTLLSALGGFLFGYDTGVVSGAMLLIRDDFNLSPEEVELLVTSTVITAALSALFGGWVNDLYGRRKVILLSSIIFAISSIIMCISPNFLSLLFGRTFLGVAIGLSSLTIPIYIAEIAKPSLRGRLVTINTFFLCTGQFIAGMINGVTSLLSSKNGWRYSLGIAFIPSLIMYIGFLKLPESPRFLVSNGRRDEAVRVLKGYRDAREDAVSEVDCIVSALIAADVVSRRNGGDLNGRRGRWKTIGVMVEMVRHGPTRRALTLGCGLMFLQQLTGINTVMYYSASIYEMSGFATTTAIWLAGFTALAQVGGIFVSVLLVEVVGRRKLVLGSLGFVCLSLIGLGTSFHLARTTSGDVTSIEDPTLCGHQPALTWNGLTEFCNDCTQIVNCGYCALSVSNDNISSGSGSGICMSGDSTGPFNSVCDGDWIGESCPNDMGRVSVFFVVAYLLSFGVGMGSMPWTINSEIYPLHYRSTAVSLSTTSNWLGNILVSSTFLTISSPNVLTPAGAFWMYAIIGVGGLVWLFWCLPETKGVGLEEIEGLFKVEGDGVVNEHDPFEGLTEEQKEAVVNLQIRVGGKH